eukprot:124088-Chlamydomonas_euryale.AAC.1
MLFPSGDQPHGAPFPPQGTRLAPRRVAPAGAARRRGGAPARCRERRERGRGVLPCNQCLCGREVMCTSWTCPCPKTETFVPTLSRWKRISAAGPKPKARVHAAADAASPACSRTNRQARPTPGASGACVRPKQGAMAASEVAAPSSPFPLALAWRRAPRPASFAAEMKASEHGKRRHAGDRKRELRRRVVPASFLINPLKLHWRGRPPSRCSCHGR